MWLKNHRRLTNLFLLDHVSIESSQSSHFPRSQFVVLVFGLYFCTRVVVYLRFRFVFSLLGLVACLRCSVCHVPSLLGLSRVPAFIGGCLRFSAFAFVARFVACLRFPSSSASVLGFGFRSQLRHSFLASAFVPGFGIRSRLLPSLPALAFVLGMVYGVWSSAGFATHCEDVCLIMTENWGARICLAPCLLFVL